MTKNYSCPISKSLQMTINNLKLHDIWNIHHQQVRYTYFRDNYGSRLDRIYAADLKNIFTSISVKPMTLSDHHCVIAKINLDISMKLGNFYWKLNTALLEQENIEDE